MGDRVNYDDEAFLHAADETGGARDRIDDVINTLTTSIDGRGKPWGTDSLGQSFAEGQDGQGYEASRTGLVTSAENVAGTLGQFYDGQIKSAKALKDMEDGNRDGFR